MISDLVVINLLGIVEHNTGQAGNPIFFSVMPAIDCLLEVPEFIIVTSPGPQSIVY